MPFRSELISNEIMILISNQISLNIIFSVWMGKIAAEYRLANQTEVVNEIIQGAIVHAQFFDGIEYYSISFRASRYLR